MTGEVPRPRAASRRAAEFYLSFAFLLALAPAALLAVGFLSAEAGITDWRGGFGLFVVGWAPKLALLSVASGTLALIVALMAGFRRFWRRALMILAITAATLGTYLWTSL